MPDPARGLFEYLTFNLQATMPAKLAQCRFRLARFVSGWVWGVDECSRNFADFGNVANM